jgi:hypothetical protein
MLIALVVVLGGISVYLNRDWFAGDNIHISHRSLPPRPGLFKRKRPAPADTSPSNPVTFGFDRKLKLTSVQVFVLSAIDTNKYALPIWHLISESNSVPTRDLTYGVPIKGMHPKVPNATPDELQPGEKYRLMIETASLKAQHDFEAVAKSQ